MAYRDEYEHCPRCGADLVDATVGFSCNACRGLWIQPASVQEMAGNMHSPPVQMELLFAADGGREQLRCPTCSEPMLQRGLFEVPIDVCEKHGIWFDLDELATVLMRAAQVRPIVEPFPL